MLQLVFKILQSRVIQQLHTQILLLLKNLYTQRLCMK